MRTVLVHGLGASSRWWRDVEPALAAELDLDVVDLPRGDLAAKARWLEARLVPGANLVGHSLGGYLAAVAAARRPELVERLALIAPAGVPGASLLGHALPLARSLRRVRPRFAPVLLASAVRTGPLALLADARAIVGADVQPELAAVAAPALVVWGEDDPLVPAARAEVWAAALPDARVEILPRVGHVPMLERPDALSRLLLEFLRRAS